VDTAKKSPSCSAGTCPLEKQSLILEYCHAKRSFLGTWDNTTGPACFPFYADAKSNNSKTSQLSGQVKKQKKL